MVGICVLRLYNKLPSTGSDEAHNFTHVSVIVVRFLWCYTTISLPNFKLHNCSNHHILHSLDRLQRAVQEEPIVTYRQPLSLRNLIVRAEVPPPLMIIMLIMLTLLCHRELSGIPTPPNASSVDNTSENWTPSPDIPVVPPIRQGGHVTCTTTNLIYLISCKVCGVQYNIG